MGIPSDLVLFLGPASRPFFHLPTPPLTRIASLSLLKMRSSTIGFDTLLLLLFPIPCGASTRLRCPRIRESILLRVLPTTTPIPRPGQGRQLSIKRSQQDLEVSSVATIPCIRQDSHHQKELVHTPVLVFFGSAIAKQSSPAFRFGQRKTLDLLPPPAWVHC